MRKNSLIKGIMLGVSAIVISSAVCSADDIEFMTEYFKVAVPSEIADISKIETDDKGISFYDSISEYPYGGFVASIEVFNDLSEYACYPSYEQKGQLVGGDGSKYDVVIVYPSDVQFDYTNADAIEYYHEISDSIDSIFTTIEGIDNLTYITPEEMDTTSIYDVILDELCSLLESEADSDVLEEAGFSYLYHYFYREGESALDKIGYAYVDSNHDGYKELVIGSVSGDETIYDMFVPVDGAAAHLLSGGERNRYLLDAEFGEIINEGSDSAAKSFATLYILDSNTTELSEQISLIFDAERDAENPYFIRYGGFGDPEPITEAEYNETRGYWGEGTLLEYLPLSER